MKTIDVTVSIPDTEPAKVALDKQVQKIVKAHRASELASGNLTPNVKEADKPKPKKVEGDIDKCLKDFSVEDLRSIVSKNELKLGGGPGRKSEDFLRVELSKLDNIKEVQEKQDVKLDKILEKLG